MKALKSQIANGELDPFCEGLEFFFDGFEKLKNDYFNFRGRLQSLRSAQLKGIQGYDAITTGENQLRDAGLTLYDEIEKEMRNNFPHFFQISTESFESQLALKLVKKYDLTKFAFLGNSAVFYHGTEKDSDKRVIIRAFKRLDFARDGRKEEAGSEALSEERLKKIYDIKHRNIVRIIGTYLADFPKCLILEYIDGMCLREIVRTLPLTHATAIEIAIQLAEAIYYLHTHGEVHRRVRPSKILIDHELKPIISPFEIISSRQIDLDSNNMIEELLYAPPEVLSGKVQEADELSDQFSLGLVICEMILGKAVFEPDTASILEVFNRRKQFFSSKKFRAGLLQQLRHAKLEQIVQKMLAEDPADRYFTLEDAARDLKALALSNDPDTELALASYRRCCIRNAHFSTDFYSKLFAHSSLGPPIRAYFERHEAKENERVRHRKLRTALLLLLGNVQDESLYGRIPQLKGHRDLSLEWYEAFLDKLIETVADNDFLWKKYEALGDRALADAWQAVKARVLARLPQTTAPS